MDPANPTFGGDTAIGAGGGGGAGHHNTGNAAPQVLTSLASLFSTDAGAISASSADGPAFLERWSLSIPTGSSRRPRLVLGETGGGGGGGVTLDTHRVLKFSTVDHFGACAYGSSRQHE